MFRRELINKKNIFLSILVILLITNSAILIKLYVEYESQNPAVNGFAEPRRLNELVEKVQKSTVTVFCGPENNYLEQGSGWVLDIPEGLVVENSTEAEKKVDAEFPTEIVTNYHVIDECIEQNYQIYVKNFDNIYKTEIWNYDEKNDLALLMSKDILPALSPLYFPPSPGWWVMAVGSPHELGGSVTFGNIININSNEVYSTAALNPGNSGGPLVDNEGNVVGTNVSFRTDGQNFNITLGLDTLCIQVLECYGQPYWE